jgi:hypothetical protein
VNDLEIPFEGKLALGGIAFAIVAFGLLSLYQTARKKREAREKLAAIRQAAVGAKDAPPGATPFFVARFRGNNPRFFRVYLDDGALLFVHAGPFFVMVDAEVARGTDKRHWLLQAGTLVLVGLISGSVIGLAALGMIGKAVLRNAANNPEGASSIMTWVMGIVAFCAVMFVAIAPGIVWRVVHRTRELDALPLSGLREQAETHDLSFRATRENVSDVRFKKLDSDHGEACATLAFRHHPTGKWHIELTKTRDTDAAVHAFRQLIAPLPVELDSTLAMRYPDPAMIPQRPLKG